MRTVILGHRPAEIDALIARRQQLGLDGYDEVWKGEYHVAPMAHGSHGYVVAQLIEFLIPLSRPFGLLCSTAFNLGDPDDFRVPDAGVHRSQPNKVWFPTAAMVLEVESPDDETWDKLDFYAAHGVDELLIVSYETRTVTWLWLEDGRYIEADHSRLLGKESRRLPDKIDWPTVEES